MIDKTVETILRGEYYTAKACKTKKELDRRHTTRFKENWQVLDEAVSK